MNKQNHFLTLLLSLYACSGACTAQAALPGSVVAWGWNDYGQTTVPVAAQSGVIAIAAGYSHTVALRNDGSVVAWGAGTNSIGTRPNYGQTMVPVAAQSGVTAIAAGCSHTVALKIDGSVATWGANDYGLTTVPIAAQSGVIAIAAGCYYTVVLKNDGSVVAWGFNGAGLTNVPVVAQSGVVAIAAGGSHAVALKNDGSVVAWGANSFGQTTVPLAAQSGVMAIAADYAHTVALKNDGSVVAWGYNCCGQTTVPMDAQSAVTAIAAGSYHTVALKNDGSVVAWGANSYAETTVPVAAQSGVVAIAAGSSHTVALVIPAVPIIATQPMSQTVNEGQSANFTVTATGVYVGYQWRKDGTNLNGGTSATYSLPDVQINQAGSYAVVVSNSGGSVTSAPPAVLSVNAGPAPTITTQPMSQTVNEGQTAGFTVTATSVHLYYQWLKDGTNLNGATGATCSLGLAQINQAGSYTVVVSNSAGSVTSAPPAVLTVNAVPPGTVVTWGADFGPVPVSAQSGVTAIAAGGYCYFGCAGHTVALKNDGSVVAWGTFGAEDGNDYHLTNVSVAARSGVMAIAAGSFHTVALKNDGSVVAWGANGNGQVTGTPTLDPPYSAIASPVILEGQVLSGVSAIAAGAYHTMALKNDGTVVVWGDNVRGQVTGTPTRVQPYSAIASPVTLGGQVLRGVTAIAAGLEHTVALKNGSVVAWGGNWAGQTTVPLAAQSGVTAIAAGSGHTIALKNDGSVAAWGANDYGQTTVPVAAHSGVTAIAAGVYHTVALKNDGTVIGWGAGGVGQSDYPHYGQTTVPAGLSGVRAIAAGGAHTVALLGSVLMLPSLTSRLSGNELILSWSTNAVGFTLQSTLSLTPPVTWIDSTNPPASFGPQWTITNNLTGNARFYRLRKR